MAIGISYLLTTARPGIDIDGIVTGTAPWPDFMWQWLGSWAGSVGFVCYAAVAFVFPSGRLVQDRRTAIRVALIVALLVAVIPPALSPSIPVTAQDGRELRGPNLLSPFGGDGSATPPPGAVEKSPRGSRSLSPAATTKNASASLPHRFSGFEQCFRYGRAFGAVPAGVEQAWMD